MQCCNLLSQYATAPTAGKGADRGQDAWCAIGAAPAAAYAAAAGRCLREARVAEYERKREQLLQEAAMIEDAQRLGWELLSRKLRLEAEWFDQQVAHSRTESEIIEKLPIIAGNIVESTWTVHRLALSCTV